MHKKAESTMIIENEVEIVQWLPFHSAFFCVYFFHVSEGEMHAADERQ